MTYLSPELRRQVIQRAGNCCEYCRTSAEDRMVSYEVDHIKSQKHGGDSTIINLCWSCYICNGYKGSDVAAADPQTGNATFLFNPRHQKWTDHFRLNGIIIEPLTPRGA